MDKRLFYAATERNREPIAEALVKFLPKSGNVLEIASGSGEHAVYFQQLFTNILWQSSDPDPLCLESISSWIKHFSLGKKMPEPLQIDVEKYPWPLLVDFSLDLKCIVCINMIHIVSFSATKALFENSGTLLRSGSHLFLYGPFKINGSHTSISNQRFDEFLKANNSNWGIRSLEQLEELAVNSGFKNIDVLKMPSNNFSVVFQKIF